MSDPEVSGPDIGFAEILARPLPKNTIRITVEGREKGGTRFVTVMDGDAASLARVADPRADLRVAFNELLGAIPDTSLTEPGQ